MFVEMVTSTFSTLGCEAEDLRLLRSLAEAGLGRVLLSYDDGHARRVQFQQFVHFAVAARDLGIEICVFGLEARHFVITLEQIRRVLVDGGIAAESVDWVTAMYSHTGRGAAVEPSTLLLGRARCPYILPVPTLIPDGRVLLCPCAVLSAPAFVVGHQDAAGLGVVLDRLQRAPFYRFLAMHGPHEALRRLGSQKDAIPVEMCAACDRYLQMDEASTSERITTTDMADAVVDYDALLPPHRRFLDAYHRHYDMRCRDNG
jgi:hypothetical protein